MSQTDKHIGLNNLSAVILVGGQGTRLRTVVSDRPKSLAQVHHRPFLAYLLDQLIAGGVLEVILCCGYLGEQVRKTFGVAYRSLHLIYSQEERPLGTAGALRFAEPLFNSKSVLVMNGDSYCQVELNSFWHWHQEKSSKVSLLLTRVMDTSRYGSVQLSNENMISGFTEKSNSKGMGWINAGIYILSRDIVESIPMGKLVSLERDVFPAWAKQRIMFGHTIESVFIDIGTPETYASVEKVLPEVYPL
jgi:D-glycero-alpha-D-manno-heptose 1-phosphate guanylyltransferase